jgi:hypothetical protein
MAQTPAERRLAQRRLAKEIREGTYKPSAAGAQARKAANRIAHDALVETAVEQKRAIYGHSERWNEREARRWIRVAEDGSPRSPASLRKIIAAEQDYLDGRITEDELEAIDGVVEDHDWYYYH